MKKIASFIFVLITVIITAACFQSCKKDSSGTTGCSDPEAFNYNANSSGTDCTYPSDKLAGTWKVSEYESKDSIFINYTATVTKVDNKTINIKHNSDYPTPVPNYHLDNITLQIKWSDKTFVPNGTITGTISDINSKWAISYISDNYKVKQTFTR